jgi:RNA polymerase subunit RPABC4/transcription elongation factor Spt4
MICPFCKTSFEVDDRGECVFVDTESLRLPMYGQVCTDCGLVQQDKRNSCVWCGKTFNKSVH